MTLAMSRHLNTQRSLIQQSPSPPPWHYMNSIREIERYTVAKIPPPNLNWPTRHGHAPGAENEIKSQGEAARQQDEEVQVKGLR